MNRRKLINQSIDYIMQHLDEVLTLDTIANQFHFSKYYFSRMFKEETGESVYAFIKRCRINQSAVDMKLKRAKSITDIGLDYGYSSSNYSSVFKQHRMISPAAFRKSTLTTNVPVPFSSWRVAHFKTVDEYSPHIQIQELSDFFVLYERYIGNYIELEKNWYRFLDKNKSLFNEKTVLMERFYDDPTITDQLQCICDICMTVEANCELENVTWIPGGKWAMYRFDGEIKDIFEAVQGIFSVWLPQSGYEMTRRYGLNIYRNIDWNSSRVVMDLCIPIQ